MRRTRRSVLRTAGLAGVAGFAGCFGTGDDGGEGTETTSGVTTQAGPAQFEAELSAPADPTVDGTIPLTVAVTNTGGEAGTFETSLQVSGPQQRSSEVSLDVAPGETARTTAEITVAYAGTYRARLGETASTEFTVQPREADLGSAVALDEDLAVTIDRASVESGLLVEGQGPFYLSAPVPGLLPIEDREETMLLVVEATVRNTGEEARTFDAAALPLGADRGGDPAFYTDMGRTIDQAVPIAAASATLGGAPLAGLEVPAGAEREGWLLAPLTRETARGPLRIAVGRNDDDQSDVVWAIAPGAEQRQLPQFAVESLSVPDQQTNGTTGEFGVTVRNTGEATGTFRGVLKISNIRPDLAPVGTVSGDLAPGETADLTGEFRMPWFGPQTLRLYPSEVERECEGTATELPFGESVTLPNGVNVELFSPAFVDGWRYSPDGVYESNEALIVRVVARLPESARGEGLGKEMLPWLEDFQIRYDPDHYLEAFRTEDHAQRDAEAGDNTLYSPVSGRLYPVEPPDEPEEGVVSGWAEFVDVGDWPDRQKEIRMTILLRPPETGEYGKGSVVTWSQKF